MVSGGSGKSVSVAAGPGTGRFSCRAPWGATGGPWLAERRTRGGTHQAERGILGGKGGKDHDGRRDLEGWPCSTDSSLNAEPLLPITCQFPRQSLLLVSSEFRLEFPESLAILRKIRAGSSSLQDPQETKQPGCQTARNCLSCAEYIATECVAQLVEQRTFNP